MTCPGILAKSRALASLPGPPYKHERTQLSRGPKLVWPGSSRQAEAERIVKSFIGRLRDECLNETLFTSLSHARALLDAWRADYNGARTHSALATRH